MGSECCQALCLVQSLKLLTTIDLMMMIMIIIIIIKYQIKETRDKETEIFEASENQL